MGKDKRIAPPGYLTAQQAMNLIGMKRGAFYDLVNGGSIPQVVPPGRKEAVYDEVKVRRYARSYQAFLRKYSPDEVYFDLATIEDIEPIREMVARESGGFQHTIPTDIMRAWLRLNNQSMYVLRRGADVVGYISMLALPDDVLNKRMTGEYWNRSIPLEYIKPFIPEGSVKLYIAEATVNQQLPDRAHLAQRLIVGWRDILVRMAKEDQISIEEIYAVATTPFGIRACQKFQMEPMTWLKEGVRDDRIPYCTRVKDNQSLLLRRYRELVIPGGVR